MSKPFSWTKPVNTNSNPGVSTGPTSPEGKATSSRNALKHGGCALSTLILLTESQEDFFALEARWFKGYAVDPNHPDNQFEVELIRAAVRAEWFMLRAERNYAEVEARLLTEMPDILAWGPDQHRALQLQMRYKTAAINTLTKQRKAVDDYRKSRAFEIGHVQKLRERNDRLAIEKERLAISKEKNKPELTWEEELEQMKQQAIAMGYRQPDPDPDAG